MKPTITNQPPFDPGTHRLSGAYSEVDRGDHIERVLTIVPMTPEEVYQRRLAACHAARRDAYPSIGDQLDAAFKARRGDTADQQAIDAAIRAVKARYPRPAP